MEFTPQELKLIERLRKQERQWPSNRWILLVVAAFVFSCTGYIVIRLVGMVQSESVGDGGAFLVAFVWPQCLLMSCFATYLVSLAIVDWRGNAKSVLLLKLLDAQLSKATKDSTGKH